MTANEIRQQFLDFFRQKQHTIVPSAPLVLKNDPTLMFANSGMVQFKDFFLGTKTPTAPRIADTQKCLRVTGKHNDLEDVGHDTYHHTLFEMLGNWSFGDYFKKEAIDWSWELLTKVYDLPTDRLYATVFGGDKGENLEPDLEALELWKQYLPESQILFGNKKDNFWEMGATGPCGPCSEIHIDLRPQSEIDKLAGRELVNQDNPLVIEIWNNVFMQFERQWDESKGGEKALQEFERAYKGDDLKKAKAQKHIEVTKLVTLPAQHVDTGMGFERLCMAIQGKTSNYDTDIFQPLIQYTAGKAGVTYGKDNKTDIALRVIADHIRAIAFTIADGQMPSNVKAGYVIRRILRRAVRYGYSYLGFREPFMCDLVAILANQFDGIFPELKAQEAFVTNVIREEENSFLRTLENGIKRLDDVMKPLISPLQNGEGAGGEVKIDGNVVFELYDTFGFPVDLTNLIAKEKGISIDEEGFEKALEEQKKRSRKATDITAGNWVDLSPLTPEGGTPLTEFIGYDYENCPAKIVRYRQVSEKGKSFYQIVLDQTPFYAESGGQAGDSGELICAEAGLKIAIFDTKKENDLIVHYTTDAKFAKVENLDKLSFTAQINTKKRNLTSNNHSATHLAHSALRQVLGTHVAQKGSLVNEDVLRFDFSHFAKMTDEELARVETIVNEKIREGIALEERRNVPIADATGMGAMALFGEKYGDFVRVITFDKNYSVELCGGTHVPNTRQIGTFKIVSEGSTSAGVRRIEAITSDKAEAYLKEKLTTLEAVNDLLKNPKDTVKAVEGLLQEKSDLLKRIEQLENAQVQSIKQDLMHKKRHSGGHTFIVEKIEIASPDALKQLSFELQRAHEDLFLVLGAEIMGKPTLSVMISESLMREKSLDASKIVKELAKHIQGGGGGQPFYATAGGKDASGLDKALQEAVGKFASL
jgi:alanyl-tRNA synthetase